MHKGKITMLGRIMAGSQAVIAHDEAGQAIGMAYYPPDIPLSQVMVEYCQQVSTATGIEVFVIDRAVNSVAMAQAFTQQGWGLLSMLDANEYTGHDRFEATRIGTDEEGHPVYQASWKAPRDADPRRFVRVKSIERLVVYWGTPLAGKNRGTHRVADPVSTAKRTPGKRLPTNDRPWRPQHQLWTKKAGRT